MFKHFLSSVALSFCFTTQLLAMGSDPCELLNNAKLKGEWIAYGALQPGDRDCHYDVVGQVHKYKETVRFELNLTPTNRCTHERYILNGTCVDANIKIKDSGVIGTMRGTIFADLISLQSNDRYPDDVQLRIVN